MYWHFGAPCCCIFRTFSWEDGNNMFLQNAGTYLPNCTTSHRKSIDRDETLLLGMGHKVLLPVERFPVLLWTKVRQAQLHDKLASLNSINSKNPSLQNLKYENANLKYYIFHNFSLMFTHIKWSVLAQANLCLKFNKQLLLRGKETAITINVHLCSPLHSIFSKAVEHVMLQQ